MTEAPLSCRKESDHEEKSGILSLPVVLFIEADPRRDLLLPLLLLFIVMYPASFAIDRSLRQTTTRRRHLHSFQSRSQGGIFRCTKLNYKRTCSLVRPHRAQIKRALSIIFPGIEIPQYFYLAQTKCKSKRRMQRNKPKVYKPKVDPSAQKTSRSTRIRSVLRTVATCRNSYRF